MNIYAESEHLKNVIDELIVKFKDGISHADIVYCLLQLMNAVGIIETLKGEEKKELVINALYVIIDKVNVGEMDAYDPILKLLVPQLIDDLISVENGKLTFNKKNRKRFFCC
jgi:hypothetical protein